VETYLEIWSRAMETCLAQGGTISHHHGIGRLKAKWMAAEHGEGMDVLRAIKGVLDPHGILNPGNMGL
jgi:alkyldihydroxyacetonephosphate synthase